MDTVIFGGSFNPPHLGHLSAALTVVKALQPDRLLIMPDCQAPHKAMAANTPDPEHRLAMCRLAFSGVPCAEVSDLEIRRGGRSYTVDTLEQLKALYPEDSFRLVIGSDMLSTFTTGWYRYEDIMKMSGLVVISREKDDLALLEEKAAYLRGQFGADVRILHEHAPLVLSSSQVRQAIREGNTRGMLSDAVAEYIRENALYP